jgi:hypothetical protein
MRVAFDLLNPLFDSPYTGIPRSQEMGKTINLIVKVGSKLVMAYREATGGAI